MFPSPSILLSISLSPSAPLWLAWALCLSDTHVSLCLLNLKPSWVSLASQPPGALVSVSAPLSLGLFSLPVCLSVCQYLSYLNFYLRECLSVRPVSLRTSLSYSFCFLSLSLKGPLPLFISSSLLPWKKIYNRKKRRERVWTGEGRAKGEG